MVKKFLIISLISIIFLFLFVVAITYGKWEYLSRKYVNEFVYPIKYSSEQGCLLEDVESLKVMNYSNDSAKVFMKGKSGSTYLLSFHKENGNWSIFVPSEISENRYCNFEVLNSEMGGSADEIYWYN